MLTESPVPGELQHSPTPVVSPEQVHALAELAARLKEGGEPARPKSPLPGTEGASARARAYWSKLSPAERRIRTLSARIGIGKAAERELEELLQQIEAQQQDDAASRGQP